MLTINYLFKTLFYFTFYILLAYGGLCCSDISDYEGDKMSNQKLEKILVVDDDTDILEIVKLALSTVGNFSIETCTSGKEALEKVGSIKPQLILLDVMMPDMDGPTTLKKIKENPELSKVPIIFLTAKVQTHEIEQFKKLGAIDVIPKPFDPMTLSETVASIWSESK